MSQTASRLPVEASRAACSGRQRLPRSPPPLDARRSPLTGALPPHREAFLGGYEAVDASGSALRRPYTALAALLNCEPHELAVVTSATAAWQQVVYGLAWTWRPGDRVLTCVAEYGSNAIALLQLAKHTGISIEVVPETDDGDVDIPALQRMLASNGPLGRPPVLVSLTHVPTSSGRVYDAAAVGAACRAAGVPFLLDACQSVGQLPVDVRAIGCDFLSGTGRKYLRAPRGSGFLFCRRYAKGRERWWSCLACVTALLPGLACCLTPLRPTCPPLQRRAGPAGARRAGQCGRSLERPRQLHSGPWRSAL